MFEGLFSTTIWLNITSILALLYAIFLCSKSDNKLISGGNLTLSPIIIILFSVIYIGTRPIWCYADTGLYTLIFNLVQNGYWPALPGDTTEPFFSAVEYFCIETTDASGWLLVVATFYILGMSFAA